MVDLRVDMVRSAREHKDFLALLFSLGNNLVALFLNFIPEQLLLGVSLLRGYPNLVEREVGEVERKPLKRLCREVLGTVDTEILLDEVDLFDILHIIFDNLGIIRDNRAVVVVITEIFVEIVGKTGVEDCLRALVNQGLHMAVHKLSREADGVAGDRLLTALVKLAV